MRLTGQAHDHLRGYRSYGQYPGQDSDRTGTCQILDAALADGQLSMAEHAQRVQSATRAATLGELRSLVGDLQTANAPVRLPALTTPGRLRPGWGGSPPARSRCFWVSVSAGASTATPAHR